MLRNVTSCTAPPPLALPLALEAFSSSPPPPQAVRRVAALTAARVDCQRGRPVVRRCVVVIGLSFERTTAGRSTGTDPAPGCAPCEHSCSYRTYGAAHSVSTRGARRPQPAGVGSRRTHGALTGRRPVGDRVRRERG